MAQAPRDFVEEFVARYRDKLADPFLGGSAEARVMSQMLDQLEREHDAFKDETLTCGQAAMESGYSRNQIALLRKQGIITHRRGDLPRKPGHGVARPAAESASGASLTDEVIAARRRRGLRAS